VQALTRDVPAARHDGAVPPSLDLIALHGLRAASSSVDRIGGVDAASLPEAVHERLLKYVTNVEERSALSGRATPGWWRNGTAPTDLGSMLTCGSRRFERLSEQAMDRLAGTTPPNAKDGLVVFLRTTDNGVTALTCCKLEVLTYSDIRWNRSSGTAATALTPIEIDDLLPQANKLQKAARLPGLGGADLWIVDEQIVSTADYWLAFFEATRLPGENQRLRVVAQQTDRILRDDFSIPDAEAQVTHAIAVTAHSPSATLPIDFARSAAVAAGLDPDPVIARLKRSLPDELGDPRYTITPRAAGDARTTWDLGDGVKLTGPRAVLEGRVAVVEEDDGTYLKVRATRSPTPSHSLK
jgi:hypothetical protein